jgi:hypothetical protein
MPISTPLTSVESLSSIACDALMPSAREQGLDVGRRQRTARRTRRGCLGDRVRNLPDVREAGLASLQSLRGRLGDGVADCLALLGAGFEKLADQGFLIDAVLDHSSPGHCMC